VKSLDELRQASEREGPTRRTVSGGLRHTSFGDVKEGDLAAVTKSGEVYRLNPEKLGDAVVPENLPGVVQVRDALKATQERSDALYGQRRAEQAIAREAIAEDREKRNAVADHGRPVSAGDVTSKGIGIGSRILGAIAVGALKFLDGFFSSPKKPTAQEVHDRAQAAGNVETQHAKAHELAREEGDLRLQRTLDEIRRVEENRQAAPEYFRPITRPINRGRDRDDDHERERERERDRGYER
jgi:hypothetical protein